MKYLVVLALCATIAFAEEEYLETQRACLTANNLSKDDLRDEDKVKKTCYYECLYKRTGMMRQDGSFDMEDLIGPDAPPERKEQGMKEINNAINMCKEHVGTEICRHTHCVHMILAN